MNEYVRILLNAAEGETAGGNGNSTTPNSPAKPAGEAPEDWKAKYEALSKELESSKEDREFAARARKALSKGSTPSEEDTRYIMAKAGYSPEEIEQHLKGGSDDEEDVPSSRRGKRKGGRQEEDEEDPRLKEVQKKLEEMEVSQKSQRVKDLSRMLDESLEATLDEEEGFATITRWRSQDDSFSEKDKAEARKTYEADLRQETLNGLKQRRESSGGSWDDRWLKEEALKANKRVLDKYRRLIGNPSKLGSSRAGELSDEEFLSRKRAPEPKSKDRNTRQQETSEWLKDELLDIARTSGSGRESRA